MGCLRGVPALVMLSLALTWPCAARAELPEGCTQLGLALTEHSCFHARFGPFEEREATAGEQTQAVTSNIDPVHTHFRVHLPSSVSVITYTPARTGTWAVFVEPDVPLRVLDPMGREEHVVLGQAGEDCPYLPRLRVYELEQDVRYRYVFGPTSTSAVVVLNEKVDDFTTMQGPDRDADGYGATDGARTSPCRAPAGFADNDTDCDDNDPAVHPDAPERCDGVDQNCNGLPDDVGVTCNAGSGACQASGTLACPASGEPARCSAAPRQASTVESCNGEDDDCDGVVDNGSDAELCGQDASRPRCVSSGNGRHCGCERDSDCGGPDSGRLCRQDGQDQRCVTGCVTGRNGCPEGQVCTSSDPAAPGFCTMCCERDDECAEQTPEHPRCAALPTASTLMCGGRTIGLQWYFADGRWHLDPVQTPARMCAQCLADADCASRNDGRVACLGALGSCARCSEQDVSRCSGEAEGAACLRSGDCGCRSDADCAPGRRCVLPQQRCELRPDATEPPPSKRQARKPQPATATPLVSIDAAAAQLDSDDDPAEADAGTASMRHDSIHADEDAGTSVDERAQGCGCQLTHGGAVRGSRLMLLWLGLLCVLRSRRRIPWALALALLHGCSEYDEATEAARTSSPGQAELASPPVVGHRSRSNDATPSQRSAAREQDAGDECTAELGDALIEHACQHAAVGPYVAVTAATTRELATETVSASHKTYQVQLPPAAGEFVNDGWLRYRPSRAGQHVFMVGPDVEVRVIAIEPDIELRRLHAQTVAHCPSALAGAYVYALEESNWYWVGLLRDAPRVNLFIEHVETFGSAAWRTQCGPSSDP